MNLHYLKAILSGFLVTVFLAFILLFFAPLLLGIAISETVALKAIEHYSSLVLTIAGSLSTVVLCAAVLFAVGCLFLGVVSVCPAAGHASGRSAESVNVRGSALYRREPRQRPASAGAENAERSMRKRDGARERRCR